MGLKINIVIIEGKPKCSEVELVESLGFKNVSFDQNALMSSHINPDKGCIAVAYWKNFTVIAHDTLPISMINLDFSNKRYFNEITLRRFFETKNNMAVLLQSITNTYGMSLSKEDIKSVIYGHSGGFHMTRGKRTQIELDYLKNSYTDAEGEVIYQIDGNKLTHDQIGENIVLWNIEHFTQMPSGELFDLQAQVFKVTDEHLACNS